MYSIDDYKKLRYIQRVMLFLYACSHSSNESFVYLLCFLWKIILRQNILTMDICYLSYSFFFCTQKVPAPYPHEAYKQGGISDLHDNFKFCDIKNSFHPCTYFLYYSFHFSSKINIYNVWNVTFYTSKFCN